MKVAIIDVNCKNSSTGKIAYSLYSALNSNGDDSSICYGRGSLVNEKFIYKFGIDFETYIHALLTRITGYTGRYSFFSTRRLLKFIDDFKPDIVHVHELHAYFANIKQIMEYLKKNNINTVWTFHCEHMYTGKCGYAFECTKWLDNCGDCPYLREYPKSLWFDHTRKMHNEKKLLFSNFTKLEIVTPSKWLAERVKRSFLNNKSIQVVFNGINVENFYPREVGELKKKLQIRKDEKIVLAVAAGLMNEGKGGNNILHLAEKMKNQNIRFIMIGVNDVSIPHNDNTILLSRQKDQNVLAEYYSLADVFILCSKRETFSMPCAEALCCGTSIVGFKSGAPESVFEEPYAKFVEYGDFKMLSGLILSAIENPIDSSTISMY